MSEFETAAETALRAMRQRAEELTLKGVAVVAACAGERPAAWASRMTVVGTWRRDPSENHPGTNFIAAAYSKLAEMADTLQDSGSGARPPLKAEFGWRGGLIRRGRTGYLLAAFSGGPADDDLKVAAAGMDLLLQSL